MLQSRCQHSGQGPSFGRLNPPGDGTSGGSRAYHVAHVLVLASKAILLQMLLFGLVDGGS